jgi:hypothetical protein
MKSTVILTALILFPVSPSWAQGVVYYGAYYMPAPVVVAPVQPIVQMTYVAQPVVTYYAAPVYTAPVYAPPVAVAAPLMHSPYSVAARDNAWVNRNGLNYSYREYGPLGAQRYHYSVHARPYGYVVRERGF